MVAVLTSVTAFAQRGIPRTNSISVSSTIVTKKKPIMYENGFQHFVEIGSKLDLAVELKGATGVNYIGGYRFNNHLFAGVGIGLEFSHHVADGVKEHVGEGATIYSRSTTIIDDFTEGDNYKLKEELNIPTTIPELASVGLLNVISIPIYVHLRGYYTKTKCAPYSSLSLGGILAPKENGIYADFSTGVDVRLKDRNHLYFAVGFWYRRARNTRLGYYRGHLNYQYDVVHFYKGEDCHNGICDVDFMATEHYHYDVYDLFNGFVDALGISLHMGFTF